MGEPCQREQFLSAHMKEVEEETAFGELALQSTQDCLTDVAGQLRLLGIRMTKYGACIRSGEGIGTALEENRGMLYYAPQCWTSDDTDAVERLKIQYGTSMVYPLSSMGAHVSAVPNHQVLRTTPIETRANVACFGTFGYELDLNQLPGEELEKVRRQIAFMKASRELIQFGTFYRLLSPFEGGGNVTAWMVVSRDRKKALVGYYRGAFGRIS